jgi:hypothetical protein
LSLDRALAEEQLGNTIALLLMSAEGQVANTQQATASMTALLPQMQATSRGPHEPRLLPKQVCWESQLSFSIVAVSTHSTCGYLAEQILSQNGGAESSNRSDEGETHLEVL